MANMIQNNFVGGEISPSLFGRSDLQAYYRSCAKAENFVVSREGSLKKRRGVSATDEIAMSYDNAKVVPYVYDRDEAGVVIFTRESSKIRAELRAKGAFGTAGTKKDVYSGTIPEGSTVKDIQVSQIGDTLFATLKGAFNKKIVVKWSTKTITVSSYAQSAQPEPVVSITATAHVEGQPTSFRTLTYGAYICRDGILSPVMTAKVNDFPATWTAGSYVEIRVRHGQSISGSGFDYILIGKKVGSFFGELVRFYPEDVTSDVVGFRDENHTPADVIYSQIDVLGDGFGAPVATNAFQQRLVFANAMSDGSDYPMTLWFSQIGNLYNFYANRPAADDDAFSPTLMSTGPSFIRWLAPYQKAMIAFTDAGIFAIAGSQNEGFSASTCQISKLSNISVSQKIRPLETETGLIFVGSDDKTLYSMAYDLQTDSTKPVHRMLMVKHLTRKAHFTSIALQQVPDQVVWCGLSDGTFASFTFERDEEVFAWAHHAIEGADVLEVVGTGTVTDSETDHTFGDVFFVMRKSGQTGSFLLGTFAESFSDTVAETTHPVKAELVTLPVESTDGTIAWNRKNVKDVLVRLFESGPLKIVPFESGLAPQVLNAGETSFTGDAKVKPMGFISDRGQLHFVSDGATDAEILMVVTKLEVD